MKEFNYIAFKTPLTHRIDYIYASGCSTSSPANFPDDESAIQGAIRYADSDVVKIVVSRYLKGGLVEIYQHTRADQRAEIKNVLRSIIDLVGMGFHPDDDVVLDDEDMATSANVFICHAFDVLGDDVYEVCMEIFIEKGWMIK